MEEIKEQQRRSMESLRQEFSTGIQKMKEFLRTERQKRDQERGRNMIE